MPESIKQISFAKLDQGMEMPHLLDIQTRAFEALLQLDAASHDREDIGLERVFKDLFPITDVHENFSLSSSATRSVSPSTPSRSASSAT